MVDTRGRFVWYELMTTDIDAARAFYTDVVGWRAHDAFAPGMHYTLFLSGENSLGGLMQLPGERCGLQLSGFRDSQLRGARMLELYHNNISVCAQKVRLVLAEKDLPWTNHHVNLARGEQLTPEFKKMNPRGVVPVLVHDGNIIVEPSVICAYLDDVFPDPPLTPRNPVERATMRLWCKLPDDVLHMACATVSFAISFGQQIKK